MSTKFIVLLLVSGAGLLGLGLDLDSTALLLSGVAACVCSFFGAIT